MAGPGPFTIAAAGVVASPSSMALTMGSAASAQYRTSGLYDTVYLPSIGATLHLNGVGLQFHTLESVNYVNGPLGVALALTASPTAVRATGTQTFTAATRPADADVYAVQGTGVGGSPAIGVIFKTTLTTTGPAADNRHVEIARGADLAATIANIAAFFNQTGTNGTNFYFSPLPGYGWNTPAQMLSDLGVIVSATSATVVTYRAVVWGTGGNNARLTEIVDSGASWAVSGQFTGGAAGTGSAPDSGTFKYRYQRQRVGDNALTYASPETSVTLSTNCNVNLTDFVDAPTRDAFDFFRWNRTTNGGSVFFRGADVGSAVAEPYVDSFSDATITGAFAVKYDDRLYRPYTAGYPVKCRYGCLYKGRVFAGGAALASKKTTGTAAVVVSTYTVTLTLAAHPTVDWIGRTFQVSGDAQTYIIVDVTEASRILTLNLPYGGSTNAAASYSVADDRNPLALYYSEPMLPNNWPAGNSVLGITSTDSSGISGMSASWDSLVVWTQSACHRVIGDSGSGFRALPVGDGMGAFTNQAVVNVDGTLYWMGANGIYRWGGSGDPVSLSDPDNEPGAFPFGIKRTLDRLNLAQRDMIVGNYNSTEKIIRWFVPLDGETSNRHVVVYDVQTGQFSLDTAEEITAVTTVRDSGGTDRTLAGDAYGNVFQLDVSVSDGVYGVERVQAVSSYDAETNTITVSGTPFTVDALIGAPVYIKAAADGSLQRAKVSDNAAGTIKLCGPITAPSAADQIVVGGILWDVQTGRWDLEEAYKQRGLPAICVTFIPSTGQMWCAAAKDNDTPTVYAPGTVRGFSAADVIDVSLASGFKLFWHRKGKCRRLCVRFFGLTLGSGFGLVGWIPSVMSAETVPG